MYLYKTAGQSENYLNYKAVYNLRYTPTRKPIKVLTNNQNLITNEPTPAFSSTFSNEVVSSDNNETENFNDAYALNSFESETSSSSSQSEMSSESVLHYNNISYEVSHASAGMGQTIDSDSKKHVMKPNKRVQYALDFLAHRLKKLLYYSMDKNRHESKLSPHLTTLGRFLKLFSLITFENVPCVTGKKPLSRLSGTCYNEVDCFSLGGIAVDRCANGFGVCCVCESALSIYFFFFSFQGQLIRILF